MNTSTRRTAIYGAAILLFGIAGNGVAQEPGVPMVVPAPACPGCSDLSVSIATMGGPAMGHAQMGVVSTGGMAIAFQENAEVVKNQPYQAQAVTEMKQTLADGSHISQTTTATVARDSDGRTIRIQKLGTMGPWKSASGSSQGDGPTLTTIFDPVAKTHIDYTSDAKVAHVMSMAPGLPGGAPAGAETGFAMVAGGPAGGGMGPMTFAVQGRADTPKPANNSDAKTESLGASSIDGIPVTGSKSVNTIPAGAIGNEKDIVITRETWYSADLKLVVRSTQSDPRFGETTYSLTSIQRSEPDPSLFQVPPGFSIDKVPAKVHVVQRGH